MYSYNTVRFYGRNYSVSLATAVRLCVGIGVVETRQFIVWSVLWITGLWNLIAVSKWNGNDTYMRNDSNRIKQLNSNLVVCPKQQKNDFHPAKWLDTKWSHWMGWCGGPSPNDDDFPTLKRKPKSMPSVCFCLIYISHAEWTHCPCMCIITVHWMEFICVSMTFYEMQSQQRSDQNKRKRKALRPNLLSSPSAHRRHCLCLSAWFSFSWWCIFWKANFARLLRIK